MSIKAYIQTNKAGLLVIILTWLIFFSRTLFGGQFYFLDDLKIIFYPLEQLFAEFQRTWQLPVWSPFFGFGQPLIGWGQLGFFTPLHVLLRLFQIHPLVLLQISIVGYFGIGLLGLFVFLKHHKFSDLASSLGAIIFAFSGFHIGHLNHVNFFTSTMMLPWLLLMTDFFLDRPSSRRAGLLALSLAVIPMSGQPQISLYIFIIATLHGAFSLASRFIFLKHIKILLVPILWLIPVGVLAFCLASFSILPLQSFLPQTERSDALSQEELLDFSYPPSYAITLLVPHFFGDHDHYWGAKGLQELSAYVGIIPLLLSGYALLSWKDHRTLRIWAVVLIIISLLFALGRYSPLYRYLVTEHWLDSLAQPGRFVFFFDVAIAIMATIGLDGLVRKNSRSIVAGSILLPVLILIPFTLHLRRDPIWLVRLLSLVQPLHTYSLLVIGGLVLWLILFLIRSPKNLRLFTFILIAFQSLTLIVYGWSFNPLVSGKNALKNSVFTETLQEYTKKTGLPPRLYADEELLVQKPKQPGKLTDPINPGFTVYQPLPLADRHPSCVWIPITAEQDSTSYLYVGLHEDINSTAIEQKTIFTNKLSKTTNEKICFSTLKDARKKNLYISFKSDQHDSIRLLYESLSGGQKEAYFVREGSKINESQKNARIILYTIEPEKPDIETALLLRHLHVTARASSARWIGALSIKPYREFIEHFFANDREPFDGDNKHVLTRYRKLFNLAGITHFTQIVPHNAEDQMLSSGFTLLKKEPFTSDSEIRLYSNPEAFPKVFMIRNAEFVPAADETRHKMTDPEFDPASYVYIDGPTPPEHFPTHSDKPLVATARITNYQANRVDIEVDTAEEAFLILNDSPTNSWKTYIDNQPSLRLIADSIFRAALVPEGHHIVSFRYEPDSIATSKRLSLAGLIGSIALIVIPSVYRRFKRI